jgi:two-component system OmpR family response regulator
MRILLVEDDHALADVVRRSFTESGHVVDHEVDGLVAESLAQTNVYDAIVLDIMLPSKEGLSVARALRALNVWTPILILTARDGVDDLVAGIDAGADDYLRKPFLFDELEARLRSITRREPFRQQESLRVGDLTLDLGTRKVRRGERTLQLSPRETAFLEYFMRNAGLVLTRRMLENALWERDRDTASNVIDVFVRRLRRKIDREHEPSLIETVRRVGYRLGRLP